MMREWLLDKKLHTFYFIFRWIIFLATGFILYAYPDVVVINLLDRFTEIFILAVFIYLFLVQLLYIVFRNRKRQLPTIVKLINIFDLVPLFTLIAVTNDWSSLFVSLLYLFIFYITLTFSSAGRWILFLLTIS